MTSTPTVAGSCRIEAEFLISDQRRFFVPCPHCAGMQWLQFRQLKWEKDRPETVQYECEHCRERFPEIHKGRMLAAGEWRPTAPGDGKTAGFHLSALYSPLGWKSWRECVEDFLRAKNDAPMLKTFVNTVLAETWDEAAASQISADALLERVEPYDRGVVPEGVLLLTAGVDVQDNRLAVSIWGWGRDEESWLIDHTEVWGDPARPEVWKQLDVLLLGEYPQGERVLKVVQACVDSGGHHTGEVYQYARERAAHGVVAIKGSSRRGAPPIGRGSKVDLNYRGKILKKGATVYMVGTDSIKDTLFARLRHNDPGPGFQHFGQAGTEEYFKQLTSERKLTRYTRNGLPVSEYVLKSGVRNEALDVCVYSLAALRLHLRKYDARTVWDQLEAAAKGEPVVKGTAKPRRVFAKQW
jgi:phage terminase large subunit GpA-like protein